MRRQLHIYVVNLLQIVLKRSEMKEILANMTGRVAEEEYRGQ